jgi:DNA polymerase-3 subunit beta
VKISVIQENLARGLQVVSRAVSARSTLPVLSNVLLRTEDAGLKLTATNLEIGVTYWVPAKVENDGAITIPARLFTDFVNSLPNERIDLELQAGDMVEVRCGRYEAHLKGIDAEEFPAIPSAGERPTTRVSQRALKEALDQVAFAAATDEARPILTGVLTKFSGDQLTLAAADNYRISVKTI